MGVRLAGRRWVLLTALLALLALAAAGCVADVPQQTLIAESDLNRQILGLYQLIFVLAMIVFISVEAALFYAVWRFRQRPGDPNPPQVHGNTRLEIAWTIAPAIVLAVIGVPTLSTMFRTAQPPPAAADPLVVKAIGHQWWWEFQYPELNVVTANEVHLEAGRPVTFILESADVIHSFWIPRLGGKMDVVPNHSNTFHLTPDKPGIYYGQCVEFCGTQHANMKFRAVVETKADFEAWVQRQRQPAAVPQDDLAKQGQGLFAACAGCHTVRGTNAQGKVGPDLTHVGSRLTIAAGMLENNGENLRRWLRDPQEVKPGAKMPDLNLTEESIDALIAYLETLK
jgi:cytochrome c oxidase subunit 2